MYSYSDKIRGVRIYRDYRLFPLFVSVSFILFYICVINKGQIRATDGFDTFDFQFVSDMNYFRLCCFQLPRRINFMLLSTNFNVITKGKIILSVTNKRQR
jgi:hypothetical protein